MLEGIGLHTGHLCTATLTAAPPHSGRRMNGRELTVASVSHTQWCTTVETPRGPVRTIEHLMAALYGAGIDDVDMQIEGGEVPILDGSATQWAELISPKAHGHSLAEPIRIQKRIHVGDERAWITVEPAEECRLHVDVEFPDIGRRTFSASSTEWCEAAPARTFGFFNHWPQLKAKGLAQGASLETVLVYDGSEVLNPGGLRFYNEIARHKWLDLLGDLSLLGAPLQGRVHAHCAGHTLHHELVRAILSENTLDFLRDARTLDV